MTQPPSKARLEIRQAELADVRAIGDLIRRAYEDLPAYTHGEIRGQLNNYPAGCFVAKLDGKLVGYCASMRLSEKVAFGDH
ncbi:carbon-nitrogen hydrolase, partial [Altererythrobacter sp.]|nr:carbon-nitrogen hydrolase [Altererythrobacter sp.]